jgi:RimJ/RimL family protein N-acetyltransferase
MLKKHLDVDTARRITGPEYHYSVSYETNPENRDEYNILVNGEYAGEVSLYHDGPQAHIGFWVRDGYRGQGVVSEALRLMLSLYGNKFAAVRMTCWINNKPAMALMQRLGMIESQRLQYPLRDKDQFGDIASHYFKGFDDLVAVLNHQPQSKAA